MLRCIRDKKGRFAKHRFVRNPVRDNCKPKTGIFLLDCLSKQTPEAFLCKRCDAEYWTGKVIRRLSRTVPILPAKNKLLSDLPFVEAGAA